MKKGLILEGGALRGLFSAGVIDVMMENGITYDGLVGVSAGACFGCNYKSGQIGRVLRYNLKYCKDKRYCSIRSLLKTGDIFGEEFCYHVLPEQLDVFDEEAYRKNPMEFHVVATDVDTGEAVYKKCEILTGENLQWIRASASMPLAARVVELEGRRMLDGGIADSIPLRYFEGLGYDRNVVVLTQCEGFRKKKNKALALMRMVYGKDAGVYRAMARRHEMYNETLDYIKEQEERGNVLVIRPLREIPIGRVDHNPAHIQAAYDLGRETAEHYLPRLVAFLEDAQKAESN